MSSDCCSDSQSGSSFRSNWQRQEAGNRLLIAGMSEDRFVEGEVVYIAPSYERVSVLYGPLTVASVDRGDNTCRVRDVFGNSRWMSSSWLKRGPNKYVTEDGIFKAGDIVSYIIDGEVHEGLLVANQKDRWIVHEIGLYGDYRIIGEHEIVRPTPKPERVKIGEEW